jgi:hypothetical protein
MKHVVETFEVQRDSYLLTEAETLEALAYYLRNSKGISNDVLVGARLKVHLFETSAISLVVTRNIPKITGANE